MGGKKKKKHQPAAASKQDSAAAETPVQKTPVRSPSKSERPSAPSRVPFYKKTNNIITFAFGVATVVFLFTYRFEQDNLTGAERIWQRLSWGVQRVTEGCSKPPDSEIEAYYRDQAGAIPVAPDFDADEGEICGNGRKYFCTSLPPDKPIPFGWEMPPRVGEDPDYEGPSPFAPFKESPHAMPSSKAILTRPAIRDRGDRDFAAHVLHSVEHSTAKIGLANGTTLPDGLSALKNRIVNVEPSILHVDDDAVASATLAERNIDFVLYDRRSPSPHPWMEQTFDRVDMRMRDAVSLQYFFPLVLGSGWALYARVEPFDIPSHVKRRMTKRVRSLLTGETPESFSFDLPKDALGDDRHRVVVSLRKRGEPAVKGRKVARHMANGDTVLSALDGAIARLKDGWGTTVDEAKKDYGVSLPADIGKAIDDMEIEIDVLYHQTVLTDRTAQNLLWYVELGLEGVMLKERAGERKIHYLEPSYAVQMEMTSEVQFLEKMLAKAGLKDFLRPPRLETNRESTRDMVLHESAFKADSRYDFTRFRTVNWIERPADMGREIVELYRGVPLKTIWDVSYASLIRSLELGACG